MFFATFSRFYSLVFGCFFLSCQSASQRERERERKNEREIEDLACVFTEANCKKDFQKTDQTNFWKKCIKMHLRVDSSLSHTHPHTQPDTQPVGWKMSEATEISGRGGSLWRQWQVFQTRIWSSKMMPRYLLLLKQNYLNYLGNGDYHTYLPQYDNLSHKSRIQPTNPSFCSNSTGQS